MKEETFIITIVSSPPMAPPHPPPPPPPLGALKCPAFSTHLKPPLALLDAARLSSNLRAPANPLHCSSPVSASPLNGLTLCQEDEGGGCGGAEKGGRGREGRVAGLWLQGRVHLDGQASWTCCEGLLSRMSAAPRF